MAAPTLSPEELHRASDGVQTATKDLCAALKEHSAIRFALDLARAQLLAEGVEGKNAEAREAQLRLSLAAEYEQLERASVSVRTAAPRSSVPAPSGTACAMRCAWWRLPARRSCLFRCLRGTRSRLSGCCQVRGGA